ncbi:hypothetical protein ABZ215_38510 [Amycolatopsis sp. NPDC006131]|uniref:hypothetical protein n=1 Tax=Amycolatopsis sp. NPDC006131 TaxID=3156731 RepID=UPI0033BB4E95
MFKGFRKPKPPALEPLRPEQLRVTLTIECLDPVHGPLAWTGVETTDSRDVDSLEAAETKLFARSMQEVTDE